MNVREEEEEGKLESKLCDEGKEPEILSALSRVSASK